MTGAAPRIVPVDAGAITIPGCAPVRRVIHQDPRGFLMETMRKDDRSIDGERFAMSYTSVTVPGAFRDRDRWHVHKLQTDRFVVPLGEMILALYDGRGTSAASGRLEVVQLTGAPLDRPGHFQGRDLTSYLVPIPPGVYHCIGNLSSEPYVLVNFPTELYDAEDEGRVPFGEVPVAALGAPFSWELVARSPGARSNG